MISLPLYAKIKDRYCIGYFGESAEVLLQLKKARPIIEKELPGIQLYICCSDEKIHVLTGEDRIIIRSHLDIAIKEIAYFRELGDETIADLLQESQIPFDQELFKN